MIQIKYTGFFLLLLLLTACQYGHKITLPLRDRSAMTGTELYKKVGAMKWNEREPLIEQEILLGNVPDFLKKFVEVEVSIVDSASGKKINASYFVSPDYLSVGSNDDWARIPLTPMTAQRIANSLQCILPTRKMVNDIYRQSSVKLEPVPLYGFRDSAIIFWHHHLIIEDQRKGRKGLISGIKKDVVTTPRFVRENKTDRVAIYGWHKPDGKPIQPLYIGHVNWYVDYSHGIRLVYRKVKVEGRWMDYTQIMVHPVYRRLLSDEE